MEAESFHHVFQTAEFDVAVDAQRSTIVLLPQVCQRGRDEWECSLEAFDVVRDQVDERRLDGRTGASRRFDHDASHLLITGRPDENRTLGSEFTQRQRWDAEIRLGADDQHDVNVEFGIAGEIGELRGEAVGRGDRSSEGFLELVDDEKAAPRIVEIVDGRERSHRIEAGHDEVGRPGFVAG